MEDPWGSPWAAADDAGVSPTAKPVPLDLEPPPRAFMTAAAVSIPALSYHSPWGQNDDDHEHGGWSTGFPDSNATTGSLSAQSNGWHGDAIPTPAATATSKQRSRENSLHGMARSRDGSISKAVSPIAWPGATATASSSPSKALSRSSSSSALRPPPLDPWAEVPSFGHHLGLPSSPPKAGLSAPSSLGVAGIRSDYALNGGFGELDNIAAAPASAANVDPESPHWDQVNVDTGQGGHVPNPNNRPDGPFKSSEDESLQEQGQQQQKSRSRTPSTCSNDDGSSRLDETRQQDSPVTSTDEDSRARPPLGPGQSVQRKVSANKVKDMVVMFDGLAKRATSEPPEPERSSTRAPSADPASDARSVTPHRPIDEPETPTRDAGPRDEGDDAETRSGGRQRSGSGTPTPRMRLRDSVSRGRSGSSVTSTPRPRPPRKDNFGELRAKFGPVQFMPDLANVDAIFSKANLGPVADVADGYVPDTILRDCFCGISERRVWYRVSRFGSSRLHNAGGVDDDDGGSYRRVAWPSSDVRAETLKTVRRWMEEDSFAGGRPTFGGGILGATKGKGNIFGWDSATSDEPAVRLDQVFAQRRLKHEAAASKRQSAPPGSMAALPVVPPVVTSAASPLQFGAMSATVSAAPATFGWSSSPISAPPAGPASAGGPSARPSSMFASSSSFGPPAGGTGSKPTAIETGAPNAGDDDDDWGEMVASPAPGGKPADASLDVFLDWPGTSAGAAPLAPTTDAAPASSAASASAMTPAVQPPLAHATTPSGMAGDSWNLSFFGAADEKTPAAAPTAVPPTAGLGASSGASVTIDTPSKPFGRAAAPAAAPPQPTSSKAAAVSDQADDEDSLVRQILQGLPDLSYMLR